MKRLFLFALAMIMVIGLAANIGAAATTITVSGTANGISTKYVGAVEASSGWNPADLADCGMKSYRLYCSMNRMEPADDNGVYGSPTIAEIKANPTGALPWAYWDAQCNSKAAWFSDNPTLASFNDLVSGCKSVGCEPVICLINVDSGGGPAWAPNPPTTAADWNEWWQYVFTIVYWLNVRNNYQVTMFEVQNEPNNSGQGWAGTLTDYYEFVRQTYDAINYVFTTYTPSLQPLIMAPSPSGPNMDWVNGCLQNVDQYFNVVDFHCYGGSQYDTAVSIHNSIQTYNPDGVLDDVWNGEWGTYRGTYNGQMFAVNNMSKMLWEMSQPESYVMGHTVFSMYSWLGSRMDGIILADGTKTWTYYAFRMFNRGFNGGKTTYTTTDNNTNVYAMTCKDSANAVWLWIVNTSKTASAATINVSALKTTGTCTVWELSASGKDYIAGTPSLSNGVLTWTLKGQSDTLIKIP